MGRVHKVVGWDGEGHGGSIVQPTLFGEISSHRNRITREYPLNPWPYPTHSCIYHFRWDAIFPFRISAPSNILQTQEAIICVSIGVCCSREYTLRSQALTCAPTGGLDTQDWRCDVLSLYDVPVSVQCYGIYTKGE